MAAFTAKSPCVRSAGTSILKLLSSADGKTPSAIAFFAALSISVFILSLVLLTIADINQLSLDLCFSYRYFDLIPAQHAIIDINGIAHKKTAAVFIKA